MHGKLKLASSPTCPCGQEDQTTEHVLQRCPLHKATRDVWPVSTSPATKLYGCKQELEKTASFTSRAALIVWPANAKQKKKKKKIQLLVYLCRNQSFFFFCVPGHARSSVRLSKAKSAVCRSVPTGPQSFLWASTRLGHVWRLKASKAGQNCRMWLGV